MKPIPSNFMQFLDYSVVRAEYVSNDDQVGSDRTLELKPAFTRRITKHSDNEYSMLIGIMLGSKGEEESFPFYLRLEIEGRFLVGDTEHAEILMNRNASAILFPYLRSTLTMMTACVNITPIILPTFNFAAMLDREEKLQKGESIPAEEETDYPHGGGEGEDGAEIVTVSSDVQ